MSPDSAHLVPQVQLPGQPPQPDVQGFSDQEWWGRWTLGKEASLRFVLPTPQTVVLDYTGYLGQMDQRISVWLDGRQIGRFQYNNGGGDKQFGQATSLRLPAGPHSLTFRSNLSRLSDGSPLPAGADPRDLSTAFYRLDLLPRPETRPALSLPADLLREPAVLKLGQFVFKTPGRYLPVSQEGLTLEFQLREPASAPRPVLDFGLLRQREGQQFTFSLDGRPFYRTPRQPGAGLVRGSTEFPRSSPGLHRLQIRAEGGGAVRDTSYLLTEVSVRTDQVSFYTERLLLHPASDSYAHRLWAGAGLVLLLLLLSRLLFLRFRGQP
ncbi:hypothetical protein DEIPH_ctg076orf0025 [Deinococcus phoenicis]|uniref:Uncharacterized protein n=1 Tax=Deinococcus phoenicis TaxID=1476583 RepID=A0A016QLU7_9DEIO|nr:hypothetical protein [Deinococcus phoenicis]EYB66764.1 hypothetical protein DEIPH_ctg076orf0025 [Deinococcus phoenicis]